MRDTNYVLTCVLVTLLCIGLSTFLLAMFVL